MPDWTAANRKRVETLANEGHSASEIGRTLGVSRNAVIGLCFRNNIRLKSRVATSTKRAAPKKPKAAVPPKVKAPTTYQVSDDRNTTVPVKPDSRVKAPPPEVNLDLLPSVSLLADAGIGCRYTRSERICCRPKVGPTSYCVDHYGLIYRAKKIPAAFTMRPAQFPAPFAL